MQKEVYGQLEKDIEEIIRKLCNKKKVEIIEAEVCPDHIHMLRHKSNNQTAINAK